MKKMKQSLIVILILIVGIMSFNGCKADDPEEAIVTLNNAPDGFISIVIYNTNKIPESYEEYLEKCSSNSLGAGGGNNSPFTINFYGDAPSDNKLVIVKASKSGVAEFKMGVFQFSGKNSKITIDWNSIHTPEWFLGTD